MIKLYYSPGACSLAAHILLEELQLPYETIKVDIKTHKADSEDFYKINPLGSVPVLMLDDGSLITQNGAILPYLGELDPKQPLLPPVGTLQRVRCQEWLAFLNADVHKAFSPLFGLTAFVDSETAQQELKEHAEKNVKKFLSLVDKWLEGKQFALGEDFSIVDPYLLVLYQWANQLGFSPTQWTHYTTVVQEILKRPAVQRALATERILKIAEH
jgi:glutathione S-transferase